jgi:hypothetical protein
MQTNPHPSPSPSASNPQLTGVTYESSVELTCSSTELSWALGSDYHRNPNVTGNIPTVPVPTAFALVAGESTQTYRASA